MTILLIIDLLMIKLDNATYYLYVDNNKFFYSDNQYIFLRVIKWLISFASVRFWLLGYKGNLAERTMALVFSVVLGIPVLFIELFILLWQTYVWVVVLQ